MDRFSARLVQYLFAGFVFLVPVATLHQAYDYVLVKLLIAEVIVLALLIRDSAHFRVFSRPEVHMGYPQARTADMSLFVMIAAGLYLLACFLSFLRSDYKLASMHELVKIAAYIFLFFVTVASINSCGFRYAVYGLMAASVICSMWGIIQFFNGKPVVSTFGNSNLFASFLIFVFPILLCHWLGHRKNALSWLMGVPALFLISFALIMAKSRGAWAGFAVAMLYLPFLFIGRERKVVLYLALTLSILLAISMHFWGGFLVDRMTEDIRWQIWRGSATMVRSHPFVGFGLGTYMVHYPQFKVTDYFLHERSVPLTEHAHSEYLEMMAETGVVGLVLFLAMVIGFFVITFRAVQRQKQTYLRLLLTGIACGVLGLLVQAAVDVNFRFPSTQLLFWFGMGSALALAVERQHADMTFGKSRRAPTLANPTSRQRRLFLSVPAIVIALLLLAYTSMEIVGSIYLEQGLRYRYANRWQEAASLYEKSISIFPYCPSAYERLAYAYGKTGDFERSARVYESLLLLVPDYGKVHTNLGHSYLAIGLPDKAMEHLSLALKFNPYDDDASACMGIAYEQKGNSPLARHYFKLASVLDPSNEFARIKINNK
jgi:O-antigen ligase